MTKNKACLLFAPLALVLSVPPAAYAGAGSAQGATQTKPNGTMKAYEKRQKKLRKKTAKAQRKALNDLKKRHASS